MTAASTVILSAGRGGSRGRSEGPRSAWTALAHRPPSSPPYNHRMDCAVYILTNDRRTVLYTGVTSKFVQRLAQHELGWSPTAFTRKYNAHTLVYFEVTSDIAAAIAREKQIKGWTRAKKIALIEAMNPEWRNLAADWT